MTQKHKIVVIGSNSFSAATFIDFTLNKGAEVIGMSRSSEPSYVFLPYKWQQRKQAMFEFHRLNLNHDLEHIMAVIEDFKPDYIINFAAQSMVAESWDHPDHWFMTNVVSTVRLHDRLRHCGFLKKYVHISTPEVYGTCQGDVKENTSYNPSTPYAVSRAACDMSLHTFVRAYQFPAVITRVANVFGPGQQLYRIIPRAILYIKLGKKLKLHGGGSSVRSFIHMRDVADGILRVARDAPLGEIYHFATRQVISIRELVELTCHKMGTEFQDHVEIVGERLGKDQAYLLDSTKARNTLGWEDKVTLEEGIDETIRWMTDNFEEIKKQPFEYVHKP